MTKKQRSLLSAPRLLSRWGDSRALLPGQKIPFSGRYAVTFEDNPFKHVPNNQLFDRSIPAKGTGHADILGASTLYAGLVIDIIKNPLQGHVNLLFHANDGAQMYAGGDMSYTAADANGQVAFAGIMTIEGGTGCYRGLEGSLTLTGILNGATGTGTLTFNGIVSFQT